MIPTLALPHHELDCALLVLDNRARICHCDQTDMIGHSADELLHQPIRRAIPGLPLSTITPCYNVAFVRFWFAGEEWHHYLCTTTQGSSLAIDLNMRLIPHDRRFFLLALIRPAGIELTRTSRKGRTIPCEVGFQLPHIGTTPSDNTAQQSYAPPLLELAGHEDRYPCR